MRAHGTHTCLVSGGFTLFSQRIAAMIGFDENHANTLAIGQDGKLTGEVAEPIFGRDGKLATLAGADLRGSVSTPRRRWRSATAPTISR